MSGWQVGIAKSGNRFELNSTSNGVRDWENSISSLSASNLLNALTVHWHKNRPRSEFIFIVGDRKTHFVMLLGRPGQPTRRFPHPQFCNHEKTQRKKQDDELPLTFDCEKDDFRPLLHYLYPYEPGPFRRARTQYLYFTQGGFKVKSIFNVLFVCSSTSVCL